MTSFLNGKYNFNQGWAVVPGFYGIPVPVPQIPGIGTGTGTQFHRTVGTGTKICGTVPQLKSRGTTNPGIRDKNPAQSRDGPAVPGFYGTLIPLGSHTFHNFCLSVLMIESA